MSKKEVKEISSQRYYELLDSLTQRVRESYNFVKYVYGIPRGGVSIAQYLSYNLEINYIDNITEKLSDVLFIQEQLLIVDDIIDMGFTIAKFKLLFPNSIFATIHRKDKSCRYDKYDTKKISYRNIEPDLYIENVDSNVWIKYPYELNSSSNR